MFLSADFLSINYGVDNTIAKFFVDREPPKDNLYWKDKLLYVRDSSGYLFIPFIMDLLYKLGIEKEQLLAEDFLSNMEQIGHLSALEETKQLTATEAHRQADELVSAKKVNEPWLREVQAYFEGHANSLMANMATPYKALHRGDIFLYSLAMVKFDEELIPQVVEQWFALISILLLLDDAEDLEHDQQTGEENAYIECGLDAGGIETMLDLVRQKLRIMKKLNKQMAMTLDGKFVTLSKQPIISQLLNQH